MKIFVLRNSTVTSNFYPRRSPESYNISRDRRGIGGKHIIRIIVELDATKPS